MYHNNHGYKKRLRSLSLDIISLKTSKMNLPEQIGEFQLDVHVNAGLELLQGSDPILSSHHELKSHLNG